MIEIIFEDACTGCNACVSVCPTHVLDASPDGAPVIARQDQCQTCFMCELYCEVDAIYVGPSQEPAGHLDPDAIRASGQVGRLRYDYGWGEPGPDTGPRSEFWRLGSLLVEGAQIAARRYALKHPDQPQPG